MNFKDIPPDEAAKAFNAYREAMNKVIFSAFGINPISLDEMSEREYKMSHQNPWPSMSGNVDAIADKFITRYGLAEIVSQMVAQGLRPAYILAHPEALKRELRLAVSMAGFDMGKVNGCVVLGIPLVASVTITPDAVIVTDRRSITMSLGVKEHTFEAFDSNLPTLLVTFVP